MFAIVDVSKIKNGRIHFKNSNIGHREPIVPGLLIGAKKCREARAILCKATCDWLIIKMNENLLFLLEEKYLCEIS